ncbi:MAG: beta-lactamase family protein [Actinomycetota bacterium]|nr:beta-lactamase family protein [Actinomycetota bacterium]
MTRRVLLAVTLVSSMVAAGVVATPAGAELPPTVTSQLDDLAQFVTAELHVPGTVLGVSVEGQGRHVAASGTAGLDDPTPVTPDMRFRIGSITKTFTATAVLQLVDDCRLGLDDTIARFQPALAYADQVSVRELLQHTSGIPDFERDPAFQSAFSADPFRVWAPQELIDLVVDDPPGFTPGTQWSYSNTNYFILGLIVESVTGRPFEEVIEQDILRPLGLNATSVPTTPAIPPPATSGVELTLNSDRSIQSIVPFNFDPSAAWAAGAMVSNVPDLERWARALATGELLSPTLQQQRLSLVPTGGELPALSAFPGPTLSLGYGLGVFNAGGYLGHDGEVNGYQAVMVHDPQTGTTIVQVQNAAVAIEVPDNDNSPGNVEVPDLVMPSVVGILGQQAQPLPTPVPPATVSCPPPAPPAPRPDASPAPVATPVPARQLALTG